MLVLHSINQSDLPTVAQTILTQATNKIICLEGTMGAGKTTFAKHFIAQLTHDETVNSPSFSIVNEYLSKEGTPIYHFDFYRINDETEALDMGIEEYLTSGNWCLIEWSERIANLLPHTYHTLLLEIIDEQTRKISFY